MPLPSDSSKPRKRQVAFIWAGRGAVELEHAAVGPRQDQGAGMQMQFARLWYALGREARPPYFPSPNIGVPSATQWARSWWVRPVIGMSASQESLSPAWLTT